MNPYQLPSYRPPALSADNGWDRLVKAYHAPPECRSMITGSITFADQTHHFSSNDPRIDQILDLLEQINSKLDALLRKETP